MTRTAKLLVVEDKESERDALVRLLRMEGYEVKAAEHPKQAIQYLHEPIDVVISDLRMGPMDGVDLLRYWKGRRPSTPFIMVTAYGDVDSAVEAMKLGAEDYLSKPVNPDELLLLVRKCLEAKQKDDTIVDLQQRLDHRLGFEKIIGQSDAMLQVFDYARRAAAVESTVLITGESGTGKELIAEAIHHNGPRSDRPFVTVNMAAVPDHLVESELFGHVKGAFTGATESRVGRFESADSGTIFIDEIGDFRLESQAKLLRVLENRTITPIGSNNDIEVDVRVVAATSRDLDEMVTQGDFREDLYYRLNVVNLQIPPLRERREDLPLLIRHFLQQTCEAAKKPVPSISLDLKGYLESHDWPGNVRQLRNCLESMVVLSSGETLDLKDLPTNAMNDATASNHVKIPPDTKLEDVEKEALTQALKQHDGNRTHAAESLGISVRTLQRRLKSWDLDEL